MSGGHRAEARSARAIDISPGTASNNISVIYTKLGVRDRVYATRYAMEHGLG
jgi:DNA-binding NarL/FixJ family response regulator